MSDRVLLLTPSRGSAAESSAMLKRWSRRLPEKALITLALTLVTRGRWLTGGCWLTSWQTCGQTISNAHGCRAPETAARCGSRGPEDPYRRHLGFVPWV